MLADVLSSEQAQECLGRILDPLLDVFLVDDHPAVREGIRRWLERDQQIAFVGEASSAEDALTQIQFSSPQVVLMDVRLPGISGVEATRRLKAQHPDLCVVILSAFGHEYLAQAVEAGADGYVLKTATFAELVAAIKQAAVGQSPIDRSLMTTLLGRFAELSRSPGSPSLSKRQLAILQSVAQGISSKEIAAQLAISNATFKRDMQRIFDYFGVSDRAQAVAEAYKRELL